MLIVSQNNGEITPMLENLHIKQELNYLLFALRKLCHFIQHYLLWQTVYAKPRTIKTKSKVHKYISYIDTYIYIIDICNIYYTYIIYIYICIIYITHIYIYIYIYIQMICIFILLIIYIYVYILYINIYNYIYINIIIYIYIK